MKLHSIEFKFNLIESILLFHSVIFIILLSNIIILRILLRLEMSNIKNTRTLLEPQHMLGSKSLTHVSVPLDLNRDGQQVDFLALDENYDFAMQEVISVGSIKTIKPVSICRCFLYVGSFFPCSRITNHTLL